MEKLLLGGHQVGWVIHTVQGVEEVDLREVSTNSRMDAPQKDDKSVPLSSPHLQSQLIAGVSAVHLGAGQTEAPLEAGRAPGQSVAD